MSNSPTNVLVFGAAGGVGCATALSASKRGARVWLAMRNTSKIIPGLSETEEKDAGFVRIEADLSDPASIKSAVVKSGAKDAFVYTVLESPDSMKGAFEALREAGITYIVLLSSFSVRPSAEEAQNHDFLPRTHGKVEIQLMESGVQYAALRPAYFNSNILWNVEGIKKGEVGLFNPKARYDFVAPEDIGAVAGTFLTTPSVRTPENEKNGRSIYLCGPKLMSMEEALSIVAQVLGQKITTKEIDEKTFLERMTHLPKEIVESVLKEIKTNVPPHTNYTEEVWVPAVENIRKYAEREPMSFAEWIKIHKDKLT